MSRLELSLLGPPVVRLNGQVVGRLTLQKARALLFYLAVEREHEHSRDSLVALLWPEQGEGPSRTNLRQALSTLREAIDDEHAQPPFLRADREGAQFHLSPEDRLDVASFLGLLDACTAHRHRHPEGCRSCAWRREQAVALYRGEFLADFHLRDSGPFDEWTVIQRERLHRRMVVAVGRLAAYYETRGDLDRAEQMITRQLELDPWMEEAHRERIRLLAVSGRRSEALAQFETCRRVLRDELGVEPSAETVRLVEQIRGGSLALPELETSGGFGVRLPRPASRLIGRHGELAEIADLLEDPDHRLVNITGAGGVGKTHLALAVARETATSFKDGVAFVPLAPVMDSGQIPGAILDSLEIQHSGPTDPTDQLRDTLRNSAVLLVLDSVEHLLPDGRVFLADLLRSAPQVAILTTSQERLGLQAEWRYELEGLDLPAEDDPSAALASGAVQLFLESGGRVDRKLPKDPGTVAEMTRICRLVEGIPLAIELAASALGSRTVHEVSAALEQDLRSLESRHADVPDRQRSQEAAFDYSWRLLDANQRSDLRRLSVFRGGWDEEAALEAAGAEVEALVALCDKSLIRRSSDGRFGFHPLLRRYALARLIESEEAEAARQAHLAYFLGLAGTAAENLVRESQVEWLNRLDEEQANFREAFGWAMESRQPDLAGQLCLSLARYWMVRGHLKEGQEACEAVLAADPLPDSALRVKLFNRAGILAAMQRRFDEAGAHLQASVTLSRELHDRLGEVTSLNSLGAMSIERQQYVQAREYLEACLPAWGELGNTNGLASTLNNLGVVALMLGDLTTARVRLEESLPLFRELGDRRMIAGVLFNLGDLSIRTGDTDAARGSLRESLTLRNEIGEVAGVAEALEGLAAIALRAGRSADSARLLSAASRMRAEVGAPIAPVNEADYERLGEAVRDGLGESAFDSAWLEGQAFARGEAIALALSV